MLSCVCDDGWGVAAVRMPVARKQHRCEECGKVIQPGEQYWYQRSLQDGMWLTAKRCLHCNDLWANLSELGYCEYTGGVLFEMLQEYFAETACYDEERDEFVLHNGRTAWEQTERLRDLSRAA